MAYKRVRHVDWANRIPSAIFLLAILLGLSQSSVMVWVAAILVCALTWWIGVRLSASRIASATTSWRLTYYPDETTPSFLRFVESLGADLGGHFDTLTPQTPLIDIDWTTLQPKVSLDITHPCKRWLDFLLNHADIDGVDTDNLGDKTLEDLINLILKADKA